MMNTLLMGEKEFCMHFHKHWIFGPYVSIEEVKGPTRRGSYILNVAVER